MDCSQKCTWAQNFERRPLKRNSKREKLHALNDKRTHKARCLEPGVCLCLHVHARPEVLLRKKKHAILLSRSSTEHAPRHRWKQCWCPPMLCCGLATCDAPAKTVRTVPGVDNRALLRRHMCAWSQASAVWTRSSVQCGRIIGST